MEFILKICCFMQVYSKHCINMSSECSPLDIYSLVPLGMNLCFTLYVDTSQILSGLTWACAHAVWLPDSLWVTWAKLERSRRGHRKDWHSSSGPHGLLARGAYLNTKVQDQMMSHTPVNTEMKFPALNQWLRSKSHFLLHHNLRLNCLKTHCFWGARSLWFTFMVLSDIKTFEHNLVLSIMSCPVCSSILSCLLGGLVEERKKEPSEKLYWVIWLGVGMLKIIKLFSFLSSEDSPLLVLGASGYTLEGSLGVWMGHWKSSHKTVLGKHMNVRHDMFLWLSGIGHDSGLGV